MKRLTERARFEQWASRMHHDMRYLDGGYINLTTYWVWRAWQAALRANRRKP